MIKPQQKLPTAKPQNVRCLLQRLVCYLGLITIGSIQAAPAHADPELEKSRDAAQIEKTMIVADEIGLEKSQEKVFWPLYENYQRDLRRLADKRIALIEQVKKIHADMTDTQATELIRRALALEEERLALKRRNVGLFLDKLPPRVVARYFQLENKIQTDVDAKIADRMPLISR